MRSLQLGSVPHWCEKFILYSSDQLWGYWHSPNSAHVQGQDFQDLRRKGIAPRSKRNSTSHSQLRQATHFWQPLLSGIKQKTFLPSLVAHCASPPPISAATLSCATGPWPREGTKQMYLGTFCSVSRLCHKHRDAPGCCTLQTEQRVLSTHGRYPVWSEADTSVHRHSLSQNNLNQKKAPFLWKVNVHFQLLWWNWDPRWPNVLHKNLTSNPGTHCSKQQCRQGCQSLPQLLPTDPAQDTTGWPPFPAPPRRGRCSAPFRAVWTERSLGCYLQLPSHVHHGKVSLSHQQLKAHPGHTELPSKTWKAFSVALKQMHTTAKI